MGPSCSTCSEVCAEGFGYIPVDKLRELVQSDPVINERFNAARQFKRGDRQASWANENVIQRRSLHNRSQTTLLGYLREEYLQAFKGRTPEQDNVTGVTLPDPIDGCMKMFFFKPKPGP